MLLVDNPTRSLRRLWMLGKNGNKVRSYIAQIYLSIRGLVSLNPSALGHIFTTSFVCDKTILLTLGSMYRDHKINGQNLYNLNPHMSFWSYRKSTLSRINKKTCPCTEWVNCSYSQPNTSSGPTQVCFRAGNLSRLNSARHWDKSQLRFGWRGNIIAGVACL